MIPRSKTFYRSSVISTVILLSLVMVPGTGLTGGGPGHAGVPAATFAPPFASSLTVSPTSGVVGGTVAASGAGFPANSSIEFGFEGRAAISTCSSDPNGSFPGTSGSAYNFTVPAVPGGKHTVSASEVRTTTNTGVGWSPN